jgi:hypothetical protein
MQLSITYREPCDICGRTILAGQEVVPITETLKGTGDRNQRPHLIYRHDVCQEHVSSKPPVRAKDTAAIRAELERDRRRNARLAENTRITQQAWRAR